MNIKHIANCILCTLVEMREEMGGCPEGLLYAGVMNECGLREFQFIVSHLTSLGMVESPGACMLKATPKAIEAYKAAVEAGAKSEA